MSEPRFRNPIGFRLSVEPAHKRIHLFVTTDRYIKAFDAAVLAAMKKRTETTLDAMKLCPPNKLGQCGKLSKVNAGEVAERLKAAVC